ncbi:hypothetical protein ACFU6S_02605 [Streptomyces sp. NPDC057456]|uniref:hypothetical protein n=1 Tax=Streptomyces sp. NPDC057456 TaxID=3346139 RepID=UPI00368BD99C
MPVASACPPVLTAAERERSKKVAYGHKTQHRLRCRAQIVRHAACGTTFESGPLGPDEYVVSSDEKTSVQARCRCHPTLAPGQARAMRVNHQHGRRAAPAYL